MAAGWPALAVVLFALAAPLLLSPTGVRADDDDDDALQQQQLSWCLKKECKCTTSTEPTDDDYDDNDYQQQQVSVKCTFSGEKHVILEQDKKLSKSLVDVELNGDGRGKLTVHWRTFAVFTRLRAFNVTGFAEVTIKRQGLQIKNVDSKNFTVAIKGVRLLTLETNAVQPTVGTADVLIEDCDTVRLSGEVISKLRSFVFRRIKHLELSENTFKNAAEGSTIEKVILENVTAEKLPSNAFYTTIELLSITNCSFDSIERNAFPVTSVTNVTLTNVTVNRIESEAFRQTLFIANLRIIGCRVREIEKNAIMSFVAQSIYIGQSEFGLVRTSAVAVANELTLCNNTFELVASRGFVLNDLHSVRVDGNTFGRLEAEAFFESSAAERQPRSELRVRNNVFWQPTNSTWSPMFRLQKAVNDTDVTGNRFNGSCGCGPWLFVAIAADDNGTDVDGDQGFADRNYCRADAMNAACTNLTDVTGRYLRIAEYQTAAGCGRNTTAYDICITERTTGSAAGGGFQLLGGAFTPAAERGVITTLVLLILCGFGAVCAVSAVTWLNARGYFIKLRSLLTSNGASGDGGGRNMARTMSAHSLSPMSVHEYAELRRHKLGGPDNVRGGSEVGVRVIVYQDKGTQTVPEELTHEMLQNLRDKLDDPEDYAEARGMIEHLYDLIRVEETCCGNGWYSTSTLDDMTSTMTTKAVTVGPRNGFERDVKSVGTGTPSLDRLLPPKINVAAVAADRHRRPQQRPPSVIEYMDPADLLYGGGAREDGTDADIYCELADLRGSAEDHPLPPPPVPQKPTEV